MTHLRSCATGGTLAVQDEEVGPMKRISSDELSKLPSEIKSLVRSGVYSLYTLSGTEAAYVLVTNQSERYFLSCDGVLLSGVSVTDLKTAIREVVGFSDQGADDAIINCA